MTFDADVVSGEIWTEHERHADTSTAFDVSDRQHAGADRTALRRQVERHLDVENSVVCQLTVDHLVVDVLGQVELAYHGLLEHGAFAVVEALADQYQLATFNTYLHLQIHRKTMLAWNANAKRAFHCTLFSVHSRDIRNVQVYQPSCQFVYDVRV